MLGLQQTVLRERRAPPRVAARRPMEPMSWLASATSHGIAATARPHRNPWAWITMWRSSYTRSYISGW